MLAEKLTLFFCFDNIHKNKIHIMTRKDYLVLKSERRKAFVDWLFYYLEEKVGMGTTAIAHALEWNYSSLMMVKKGAAVI